jgi:hypothetical protein
METFDNNVGTISDSGFREPEAQTFKQGRTSHGIARRGIDVPYLDGHGDIVTWDPSAASGGADQ